MANERSEDEKLTQAPITVILGRKEYGIAPLVIRDSREWRKKVITLIAPLPGLTTVKTRDMKKFEEALTTLVVTMPDQVIELFFEYAKDLDREDIEGKATDAELAQAFKEVVAVAFPLAQSAPDVLVRLQEKPEESQKTSP